MTKQDILDYAGSKYSSVFCKALSCVLDDECEYESDGLTIRWENVPGDDGANTFAGLTTKDDEITPDNATPQFIADTYFNNYWKAFSQLPAPISQLAFSEGVNFGIHPSVKVLQLALNDYGCHLVVDGQIGDNTYRSAWQVPDQVGLGMAFIAKCRSRYYGIVAAKPEQQKFLSGWNARLNDLQKTFLS